MGLKGRGRFWRNVALPRDQPSPISLTAPQGGGPGEVLSDYRGYDLRQEWEGRERTTRLEQELLADLAKDLDRQRWLELGCGYGRVTPVLASASREFVALDLNDEALVSVPVPKGPEHFLRVAANLHHLPFEQDSFTVVSLIRVLHHLEDPRSVLREILRVLVPGGSLLLSYAPKPTLGTLQQDILRWIRGTSPGRTYTTFSRRDVDFLGELPFPIVVPRAAYVRQLVEEAGGLPAKEWGHGPEALERVLPLAASRALSRIFGTTVLASTRFLLCHKPGGPTGFPIGTPLRWSCPRCHSSLDPEPTEREGTMRCPHCAFPFRRFPGLVDARYIPPHSRRVGPDPRGARDRDGPLPDPWGDSSP